MINKSASLIKYLLEHFPTSISRTYPNLNALAYLCDWSRSINYGEQISSIEWTSSVYGPSGIDALRLMNSNAEHYMSVFPEGGPMLMLDRHFEQEKGTALSESEIATVNSILEIAMSFDDLMIMQLVFSTYPFVTKDRYVDLDLPELAKKYKEQSERN